MHRFSVFLLLLIGAAAGAQDRPVGVWRAHLPYNSAQGIATDGLNNYVICNRSFFTYSAANGESERYSKVEGMHESSPVAVGYDRSTATCIIGYSNSNIDLFRHNNFKVLPDLKNKSFSGSKSINHIYADGGMAYLSTGLGIIVIDLEKQEVKETYVFSKNGLTMAINAFTADSLYFYAASSGGLYRILRTSATPQVFASWQPVDLTRSYSQLAVVQGALYAMAAQPVTDTLFRRNGAGVFQPVFHLDSFSITHLDGGRNTVYAGVFNRFKGSGKSYHLSSATNAVTDSLNIAYPRGTIETDDGRVWTADLYQGLGKREDDGHISLLVPQGPGDNESYDIYARDGDVWVAHGGVNSRFYTGLGRNNSLSHFRNEQWTDYHRYSGSLFDSVFDFVCLTMDQATGTLYAGSAERGVYERQADGTERVYKQESLEAAGSNHPATGVAVDGNGNLWVNQSFAANELAARDADGHWYHHPVPENVNGGFPHAGTKMIVDDLNQKWYVSLFGGGVIVFDDQNDPANGPDPAHRRAVLSGKGRGNLPSNGVISLMKDRDGAIWIGTDKGIGIFSSPSLALSDRSSDAEQRIVQYDQFAGYLFSNESVFAMAVDGANRKWIGTNNGVWLLSPDASKIINRFTVDNSPLPSNTIQSITVDPVTGDVYIGTVDGLVSYRGTATEGSETAGSIQTFPSPVSSDYSGPITMRGFTTDADVRITDITGQLIYRAKSAGGQLVWNGMDYKGRRPQSGVLLIFATNKDGTQAAVGKMVMMH